jgi:hypothetical protein
MRSTKNRPAIDRSIAIDALDMPDLHHYAIPQKLLDSIFNELPVFMHQWGREKAVLYPVEIPPP